MPLLDIEKQLFVCKDRKGTIEITVKNAGTGPLELRDVFPIGECKNYVDIDFSRNLIKKQTSAIINVTINDYPKPAEIQFDTNCPRTGKIIYVLHPASFNFPHLWLFPDEKYNGDQVFFSDPKPHLQLPIIVQSKSDKPLEFDFYLKLNENSATSHEIDVYCGETGRKVSSQGKERRYQILNTQEENYQVHFANIHLPKTMIRDGSVEHTIQLEICANSYFRELKKQEISIQLTKLKIPPIGKKNLWLRFWLWVWKKKRVKLKIKNLGTHPLRIFSIPADPDKIEVKYLETDNGKTEVSYPIVIRENENKKLDITITSSFTEWLWNGIDLSNVSIPIYTNTASDPKKLKVFTGETKIKGAWVFWISLFVLVIAGGIALFAFLRQPEQDVVISSYPHGRTVYIEGEPVGTTPTWLRVKEKAIIRIGDSPEYSVKEVLEDGLIFYREKKKESQNEQ